jgi:hypothetical protein
MKNKNERRTIILTNYIKHDDSKEAVANELYRLISLEHKDSTADLGRSLKIEMDYVITLKQAAIIDKPLPKNMAKVISAYMIKEGLLKRIPKVIQVENIPEELGDDMAIKTNIIGLCTYVFSTGYTEISMLDITDTAVFLHEIAHAALEQNDKHDEGEMHTPEFWDTLFGLVLDYEENYNFMLDICSEFK